MGVNTKDMDDTCGTDCPGKCRVFGTLFAACDYGDDFAGSRGFPLVCEMINPGREGDEDGIIDVDDDLDCVTLADYPNAITHSNSNCWNQDDYCLHGTCRVLGPSGSEFFGCDYNDHFKQIFPPLC